MCVVGRRRLIAHLYFNFIHLSNKEINYIRGHNIIKSDNKNTLHFALIFHI